MSFDIYSNKPKLVDSKLIKYYNQKNKAAIEEVKEPEVIEVIEEETIQDKILKCIKEFMIENYGFVILFSLIILLLYVRYIEVSKKKKKIKEMLEANYDLEDI
jgi:hypothetical protein